MYKELIMTTGNKIQWLVRLTAAAALLATASGCSTEKTDAAQVVHGEEFVPYDAERPVYQFSTMQAANSARADATLRAYHFDGTALNSLGEERLDLILRNGDTPTPLTVYLDLPADDSRTQRRHNVVTAFLTDRGLSADQIVLKSGPNPDSNSFVAPLLAAESGGAAAPPAGGAAPPAAGAGH
jgi:hypothetical protein